MNATESKLKKNGSNVSSLLYSNKNKFGHSNSKNNLNSNAKKTVSNGGNNLDSPKGLKRKHIELDQKKEEIVGQLKFIKTKIDDIYDKYSSGENGKEWKEELMFELKQENVVDLTAIIPKSLNTRGSHLLEYTKFWILFIELKFPDLELLDIVSIFDNALMYEQNDLYLLHDYMIKLFSDNFEKEELLSGLEKVNGKGNHFRVPEKVEDLTNHHIKYLLMKHELMSNNVLISNINTRNTPISSKKRKLISNDYHSNTNNIVQNILTNSNFKKENNISNSAFIKINKPTSSVTDPISAFNVYENNAKPKSPLNTTNKKSPTNEKSEEVLKTAEFPNKQVHKFTTYEVSVQTDINIINSNYKERSRQSIGINTSNFISPKETPSKISYSQLIERNKFELNVERTNEMEIVQTKIKEESQDLVENAKKTRTNTHNKSDKVNYNITDESSPVVILEDDVNSKNNFNEDNETEKEKLSNKTKKKNNKKRGKSIKNKNSRK